MILFLWTGSFLLSHVKVLSSAEESTALFKYWELRCSLRAPPLGLLQSVETLGVQARCLEVRLPASFFTLLLV